MLSLMNVTKTAFRAVPVVDLSILQRGLASHYRISEQSSHGIKMRISSSKVKNKQFLEPNVEPIADNAKPLAADDPRRFYPVSAANANTTTLITYDKVLDRFISTLMREGKKVLTRQIVEKAFVRMKHAQLRKLRMKSAEEQKNVDLATLDPLRILHRAIDNCRPVLRLEGIRRGGIMYQVPVPITPNFANFQAMRWIIESCRERESKADTRFDEVLAEELLAAGVDNTGKSVRKKQDLHRRCEQNRAYAHFRW